MSFSLQIKSLEEFEEKQNELSLYWKTKALKATLLPMLKNANKDGWTHEERHDYFFNDWIVIFEWEKVENRTTVVNVILDETKETEKMNIQFYMKDENLELEDVSTITNIDLSQLKKHINEMDAFLKTWDTMLIEN